MHVKKITLTNFRNYAQAAVELGTCRNILIGANAQGKTNFLEAIELLTQGESHRTSRIPELVRSGASQMSIQMEFETQFSQLKSKLEVKLLSTDPTQTANTYEKKLYLNDKEIRRDKEFAERLTAISFKSHDLNLLRGSPRDRRHWLDQVSISLKPSFRADLTRYQKLILQRNRLLKTLFERGKLTLTDRNELSIWDEQVAQMAASIIKKRIKTLTQLLPVANEFQKHISQGAEYLTSEYEMSIGQDGENIQINDATVSEFSESEICQTMLNRFKQTRYEEISRKQTLCGPHRDNINFFLDGQQATSFASQGQQRSIVLALKLAELKLVQDHLQEPPILLLDDVMAELDLTRQSLLFSMVHSNMQTIITTTHLSNFQRHWLDKALIFEVLGGTLTKTVLSPSPALI